MYSPDLPAIAVVILNWNGKHHLQQFLPSVLQTTYVNHQVWVVDNGSTDDSVVWLRENHADKIRIIELSENAGYAGGYNEGLKSIAADVFVLLNSDVEVSPEWLNAPAQRFAEDTHLGALQPTIRAWKQQSAFEYAGAAGGYIDAMGYPFCAGRLFEQVEEDLGQYAFKKHVFWASGACMFVRAKAYWQAGGLDARYFAHMEEIDLCWRLQHLNYSLIHEPLSVVYHLGGGSLAYGNPRKTFLNFRNSLITLQKNLPLPQMFVRVILRLLLDFPAALKFAAHGSWGDFWAVVRAHWSFFGMQAYIWQKRKEIKHKKKPAELSGMFHGSALYAHFFGRKAKLEAFILAQRVDRASR